jgi:ribonuclease HI
LTAAVQALNMLKSPCKVDLYTDSEYLRRGITEWLPGWRARNWRRRGGKLANVDLWKELDAAIRRHDIQWHWVRGHAGNRYNERVDHLAKQAIRKKRSKQ